MSKKLQKSISVVKRGNTTILATAFKGQSKKDLEKLYEVQKHFTRNIDLVWKEIQSYLSENDPKKVKAKKEAPKKEESKKSE